MAMRLGPPGLPGRLGQRRAAVALGSRLCTRTAAVAPPHSGYHFDGTPRRFFEGWYWKVQLPGTQQSFAVIFSIEDPGSPASSTAGTGIQVMGPDDGYVCQFSRNTTAFWADRTRLELGAAMRTSSQNGTSSSSSSGSSMGSSLGSGSLGSSLGSGSRGGTQTVRAAPQGMLPEAEFFRVVEHGFQASATQHQGRIISSEAGAAGAPFSNVPTCSWSFTTRPIYGWGGEDSPGAARTGLPKLALPLPNNFPLPLPPLPPGLGYESGSQRATAGWLSVLSVFEPHWQVLMAHGLSSGWLEWGGQRFEFQDAPTYAEKNWGGGFPTKWHWVQCNTFDGQPNLSVTAVGARRALLLGVQGLEEDVGMIGVHWEGKFIELVPWNGDVEWDVDPWGRWYIRARNAEYEALLEATCDPRAGTVLRAPTSAQGLAPFCKDTFFGRCRLRLWRRGGANNTRESLPVLDATSSTAALEVGGGPWWSSWSARAEMKEPFRTLVQVPIDVGTLSAQVPSQLKPPGL